MIRRLEGRRTVVTGAASGIGRATAFRFAQEGALVGLIDIDPGRLGNVESELRAQGAEVLLAVADVADETATKRAFESLVSSWGGIDVVVSNAGIEMLGQDARVAELDASVWHRIISVNLTGQFHVCKYAVRALQAAGGGALICTASPCGVTGMCSAETAYSASKAGILGMVRAMAADYAPVGIRVNAVIPGFIDTPMNAPVMGDDALVAEWTTTIPIRRIGRPEEVAAMMAFLASDDGSYAVGGVFTVDGGQTAI